MSATIIYMQAYLNNFGHQQSYHAFADTLIRICEELDNELDNMVNQLSAAVAVQNYSEEVLGLDIDVYLKKVKQRDDTFEFLHNTMQQNNNLFDRRQ